MSGSGGRGGWRGGQRSFGRDNPMGLTAKEQAAVSVTQPPLIYPPLHRKPVPLKHSVDVEYLLILRQNIIDHMQISTSYLRLPDINNIKSDKEIDKLVAQLPCVKEKFDWELFPEELRPKIVAKRTRKKVVEPVNVEERLNKLEQMEHKAAPDVVIKQEAEEENEEEAMDEVDEEMDDGTDYANNYFDNGEGFDDEDDNLDDGPVY